MKKAFFTAVLLAFTAQAMLLAQQVIDVDLYTLLSEWEDNSLKVKQQYGNKTIRTTGEVYSISSNGSVLLQVNALEYYFMSMMMMGITDTTLWVYFNKAEMSKLANLRKEQTITVRGVYDGDRNAIRNAVLETGAQPQAQQQQPQAQPQQQQPQARQQPAQPPQNQQQQTGQIKLYVYFQSGDALVFTGELLKIHVTVNGQPNSYGLKEFTLKWQEAKEIMLPAGNHIISFYVDNPGSKGRIVTGFSSDSGTVSFTVKPSKESALGGWNLQLVRGPTYSDKQ